LHDQSTKQYQQQAALFMPQMNSIQEISVSFQGQRYFPSPPVAWVSPERSPGRQIDRKCSAAVIYITQIQLASMHALRFADSNWLLASAPANPSRYAADDNFFRYGLVSNLPLPVTGVFAFAL